MKIMHQLWGGSLCYSLHKFPWIGNYFNNVAPLFRGHRRRRWKNSCISRQNHLCLNLDIWDKESMQMTLPLPRPNIIAMELINTNVSTLYSGNE